MLALLEVIKRTADFFRKAGIETPRLDAELILADVLGLTRMELYQHFERPLTEVELDRVRPLVKRRSKREPLQHILGWVDFYDLRIKVDRRALIPRPETEELVDLLARRPGPAPGSILDLGAGSGALTLALARAFPEAKLVGVERSAAALELARENARTNGMEGRVRFLAGDWFGPLEEEVRFDLIVSNPPYLTEEEWETAQPEVRDFEPREALVASDGGCADLERILAEAPRWLTAGGLLALETGVDQHVRLGRAALAAGLVEIESKRDLSGRDRYVWARRG
jgi:release factor glutamine methyltransferase